MNKSELISELAKSTGFAQDKARKVIEALFDTDRGLIAEILESDGQVQITGFGTFETRQQKSRLGRNPQTGEEITIAASTAVSFRAGRGLKRQVQYSLASSEPRTLAQEAASGRGAALTSIASSDSVAGREEVGAAEEIRPLLRLMRRSLEDLASDQDLPMHVRRHAERRLAQFSD